MTTAISPMKFKDHMDDIFDQLTDLTPLQRHTIKERYRFLMSEYRARCRLYSVLFYLFRTTVTVGSLAVPALLSIQNNPEPTMAVYWFTWALSLAVTTANGVIMLFKLDKQFFKMHATAERLRSETWQYIQLAGRYSGHYGHPHRPTHKNQYVYYCSQLEKINMKRVDDEYLKTGEETQPAASQPQSEKGTHANPAVPSPPDPASQTPGENDKDRQDSITLIEDDYEDDEEKSKKTDKKAASQAKKPSGTIMVQMSELSESPTAREPVLPKAPDV
jgi:hypothetical protein